MRSLALRQSGRVRASKMTYLGEEVSGDELEPVTTIAAGTIIEHEIEIKRSRFIATITRTDDETSARSFIDHVRSQHPSARHNCSAFLINEKGRNPIQHSSDDGEPAGTAGTPMLDALRLSDTWNVTVVVTRYFGGTLLGAGGLIRAYSSVVSEGLQQAQRVELRPLTLLSTHIDINQAGRVEADLRARGVRIHDIQWHREALLTIAVEDEDIAPMGEYLAHATKGESQFTTIGTEIVQVEIF